MRLERLPEEDHEIDPALNDRRTDLLIATQRAAQKPCDVEAQFARQQRAGRTGGKQRMLGQCVAVVSRPVSEV